MELNSLSFAVFTRLAGVIFEKAKESLPKVARSSGLFVYESVPANAGDIRDYAEIDLDLYARRKSQGDQASRARVVLGYNKNVSLVRFARDIGITYEMRHFNKYPDVLRRLSNLGEQPGQRLEL